MSWQKNFCKKKKKRNFGQQWGWPHPETKMGEFVDFISCLLLKGSSWDKDVWVTDRSVIALANEFCGVCMWYKSENERCVENVYTTWLTGVYKKKLFL